MDYNLTQKQKDVLTWLVEQVRNNRLKEEFYIAWDVSGDAYIPGYSNNFILEFETNSNGKISEITRPVIDALIKEQLILLTITKSPKDENKEINRTYSITGKGYEAVESNFDAPDTSFLRHLTPLGDITNLDSEIKKRCLPILGAGSNDPALWDAALRTAGVILEQRLRDVGQINDPNLVGRELAGKVFGPTGTLASKFTVPGERDGYRDLYSGFIGAMRNPIAHKLLDQKPERAGATLMFTNVLLELLEELR